MHYTCMNGIGAMKVTQVVELYGMLSELQKFYCQISVKVKFRVCN